MSEFPQFVLAGAGNMDQSIEPRQGRIRLEQGCYYKPMFLSYYYKPVFLSYYTQINL